MIKDNPAYIIMHCHCKKLMPKSLADKFLTSPFRVEMLLLKAIRNYYSKTDEQIDLQNRLTIYIR